MLVMQVRADEHVEKKASNVTKAGDKSRILGVHRPTTELSLDYLAFTCHPIAGPATQLLAFTQLQFLHTNFAFLSTNGSVFCNYWAFTRLLSCR